MLKPVAAVIAGLVLSGCTRVVASPQARPQQSVAPISALQVADLLSPHAEGKDGNLFITAEPEHCSGLARESDPPFLNDHGPVAYDGGNYVVSIAGSAEVYVAEMVAVYPSNFDAGAAVESAQQTIESCHADTVTVTSMQGRTYAFDVLPPGLRDDPNIVLWSLHSAGWDCDNAFVAVHNAAVEITGCGTVGGFDIASAARDAEARIESLANTAA